jgi:2-C-methyl-D-erythritol 4-phosphate cytidylyltransferase
MNSSGLKSQISNLKSKNYAIIVGGGSGTRMQAAIPKQFLLLNGKPVLMHTLEAFHYSNASPALIVVLPEDYHSFWKQLCNENNFEIPHQLAKGGETRFHSVKNGLEKIEDGKDVLIAVHDAVRPLTSKQIIDESYLHAAKHGNAIAAIKSRDSVRQLKGGNSISINRDEIYLIQTPQTFQSYQLKKAYLQPYSAEFTDDARVVEKTGVAISLIEGSYQNIKITFPEDIAVAELLMAKSS